MVLGKLGSTLRLLPVFLLSFACGVDSGALMAGSFLLHLVFCHVFHEPVFPAASLLKSRLFHLSLAVMMIWLLTLWIPMHWTGGDGKLLLKYLGRMLPLVMVAIMARKECGFFSAIWLGLALSYLVLFGDTLLHPVTDPVTGRLKGRFSSPNGLAAITCLFLPWMLFGIVHFFRSQRAWSAVALVLYAAGLAVVLLTGSRNAWIQCALVFLVFCLLLGREKNIDSPHNIFLQTLNESGRIGLAGFLLMLSTQLILLLRGGLTAADGGRRVLTWSAAALLTWLTAMAGGFFDYDFFSRHAMHLFWFFWGVALCDIVWRREEMPRC